MNCPHCDNELEGTPEAGSWTICPECGDVVVCTSPGYFEARTPDPMLFPKDYPAEFAQLVGGQTASRHGRG